jgi:chemotaxis protein MotB
MSALDSDDRKREIIIVKRRNDDDEHVHHGGVWKIAFADFMTALMCFFLVMWLVNASNEQTKAAIASYFNPMTLVDSAPSSKGLSDPGDSQSENSSDQKTPSAADAPTQTKHDQAGPGKFANSVDSADSEQTSDAHLFSDPYAVLAEIAAQTAMLQNVSEKGDGGAQSSGPATGANGGESYRDPFAPDFWSQTPTKRLTSTYSGSRSPTFCLKTRNSWRLRKARSRWHSIRLPRLCRQKRVQARRLSTAQRKSAKRSCRRSV